MRNLSSSILWALLLGGLGGVAGCSGPSTVVRYERPWPESLRGALNLSCHNLDHLGYGMHYDIVLNDRQEPLQNYAFFRRTSVSQMRRE